MFSIFQSSLLKIFVLFLALILLWRSPLKPLFPQAFMRFSLFFFLRCQQVLLLRYHLIKETSVLFKLNSIIRSGKLTYDLYSIGKSQVANHLYLNQYFFIFKTLLTLCSIQRSYRSLTHSEFTFKSVSYTHLTLPTKA